MKKILLLSTSVILLALGLSAQTPVFSGTVGTAFSNQIAPAGIAGYLMTVIPSGGSAVQEITFDGLTYSYMTGILSGTPTAAGAYSIAIQQATATAGVYNNVNVGVIISAALPPSTTCTATAPCVTLSCTPSTTAGTTTTVYRSPANSSTFTKLASGLPANCTYTDTNITAGTTYNYEASAELNGVSSAQAVPPSYSNVAVAVVAMNTTNPTLTVTATPNAVTSVTPVTLSISVGGTPTPTGTVTVSSIASGFTSVTGTLVKGVASVSIPTSVLAIGVDALTVAYTPDSTSALLYNSVTGSVTVTITPAAPTILTPTNVTAAVAGKAPSISADITWVGCASCDYIVSVLIVPAGTATCAVSNGTNYVHLTDRLTASKYNDYAHATKTVCYVVQSVIGTKFSSSSKPSQPVAIPSNKV